MYRDKKVVRYQNLRGVDFSRLESLVDKNHSPYCVNMMPDSSINPVKRPGWQTKYSLDDEVYNIWFCTLGGRKFVPLRGCNLQPWRNCSGAGFFCWQRQGLWVLCSKR